VELAKGDIYKHMFYAARNSSRAKSATGAPAFQSASQPASQMLSHEPSTTNGRDFG
jgi:hypothetical protein